MKSKSGATEDTDNVIGVAWSQMKIYDMKCEVLEPTFIKLILVNIFTMITIFNVVIMTYRPLYSHYIPTFSESSVSTSFLPLQSSSPQKLLLSPNALQILTKSGEKSKS